MATDPRETPGVHTGFLEVRDGDELTIHPGVVVTDDDGEWFFESPDGARVGSAPPDTPQA